MTLAMSAKTALLPAHARDALEPHLPGWLRPLWWADGDQMVVLAAEAQIAWVDLHEKAAPLEAIRRATGLRWLSSAFAGVDWLPLAQLQARGVRLTNGSGLAASQVAEFAVMAMLAHVRGLRQIFRAMERGEWLPVPPSHRELAGSRALVIGFGAIGQHVARMLRGFGVEVIAARSRAGDGALGPGEWQARLGEFDWVVLTLPGTAATAGLIGAAELAAMKADAVLVNFARAGIVDQAALLDALQGGRIGGAILDLADPEPLPPDHPLWACENCYITMHLSGIPTDATRQRGLDRFLRNCAAWQAGQALEGEVDLARGY